LHTSRLLDESPAWLVASGKLKEAKRIMQKISKINGNIEDNPETLIEKIEDGETPVGTWIICVEFMKHFWLVIRTLVICLAWYVLAIQDATRNKEKNNKSLVIDEYCTSLQRIGSNSTKCYFIERCQVWTLRAWWWSARFLLKLSVTTRLVKLCEIRITSRTLNLQACFLQIDLVWCLNRLNQRFPTVLWPCTPSASRQMSTYPQKFLWQNSWAKSENPHKY